ncbi:MAG TPA: MFS transporter [Clostridiaceae bacterium]|nr:MFS transporter [Clostridiaceae bacterium]
MKLLTPYGNKINMKSIVERLKGEFRFKNKGQALFLLDGIVINAAYMLTTGVILSGYLLNLEASDFLVALVNNSTNYTSIMSLFSYFIFEKVSNKKRMMLSMNFLSRLMIFLIIVVPMLINNKSLSIGMTVSMVIISDIIWAIYRVAWVVWIMDTTPDESISEYTYLRMLLARLFMGIASIVGGVILDYYNKGMTGFRIVFTIAFVLSVTDLIILRKVESVDNSSRQLSASVSENYFQPVKQKDYRNYLFFIFLFYMVYTMSISFAPVYLIKYLDLDYKFVSAAGFISNFSFILSNRLWAKIERKRGITFVMGLSAAFFAFELLLLGLLRTETSFIYIISCISTGVGLGGFTVTTMTYRYNIIPVGSRIIYEGWFYFFYGMGMLLAPFAGELFIHNIEFVQNMNIGLNQFQLLFFFAFVIMWLLIFISFVKPKVFKEV